MRPFLRLWPAAASALLLLSAFPPFNLGLVALVGVVPLLLQLMKSTPRRGLAVGYAFGFVYMTGQMFWVGVLVARWTGSPALAGFVWILCGFLGAWYFALFGWLAARLFERGFYWAVPLLWAGIEVFRSYIPGLAFPWGLIADPIWFVTPIIQSAYYGSIFLVGAWVCAFSLIVALWIRGEPWLRIRPLATAFILVGALSLMRYATPEPNFRMPITVGQTGVDMAFGDPQKQPGQIREAVKALQGTALTNGSKLLLLPEGISEAYGNAPQVDFPLYPDLPMIFGGKRGRAPSYQSVFAYDEGKWQYADKTRLVIFGEYVPGRNWIPFLSAFNLPSGDLEPGEKLGTLQVAGIKVGPLVCFEGMFPDLAYRQALAGSQLLAVSSIDDWYMGTPAPDQLKSESVWRAVETGLPLIRSASLGYSIAVDGHGRVLDEAPTGKTVPMRVEVPIPDRPNVFPAYPAFPAIALLTLGFALLLPWIPEKWFSRRPKA